MAKSGAALRARRRTNTPGENIMRHSKDAQANAPRADARDDQASASAARSMRTHRPDLRSYKRRLKAAGLAREDVDETKPWISTLFA
jgi:hypothetical protein